MVFLKTFYQATTAGTDIVSVHAEVEQAVRESGVQEGLVTVGVQGSEAAIGTCEPGEGVVSKLKEAMARFVADREGERFKGSAGRSYSVPGTMISLCFGRTLTIPIAKGKILLEPWLKFVLFDFDMRGLRREYYVHILGEEAKKTKGGPAL